MSDPRLKSTVLSLSKHQLADRPLTDLSLLHFIKFGVWINFPWTRKSVVESTFFFKWNCVQPLHKAGYPERSWKLLSGWSWWKCPFHYTQCSILAPFPPKFRLHKIKKTLNQSKFLHFVTVFPAAFRHFLQMTVLLREKQFIFGLSTHYCGAPPSS